MGAVAAGREIRGEGVTPEAAWREWLARHRPVPIELDALLGHADRLVVVAPHPDDEVLACGGLLAMHSARGGPVRILAASDGEASHRGDPAWSAERLAACRRAESARGMQALGIGAASVQRLGLPDGELARHHEALALALSATLRTGDLALTTWVLDGHPDHEACAAAVSGVCQRLGIRHLEAPVWMWHWSVPDDRRVPWRDLREFALPHAVRMAKSAALAEHLSQRTPREPSGEPVLGPAIIERAARAHEYYFLRNSP